MHEAGIASGIIALARSAVLVTSDTDFRRISGLSVEDRTAA